jgi:hypothetical protein
MKLKYIAMFMLTLLVACSQPSGGASDDAAVVSAVEHAAMRTPEPPSRFDRRARGTVRAPAPPDMRTPSQLAAAACGGRCVGTAIPKLLMASTETPIIPPSWTVPNWYVDPANSSGVASDSNSGTAATGAAGSGIGPLLTFQELNVHRWGCIGTPNACPRLRQSTTVTFLSSQTTNADPVYFSPSEENGAQFLVQGVLTSAQQVCSTTLSAVTAKNRATPQLLKATFTSCAGAAVNQLVVNTTHPSRAWTYAASGGGWLMSQPMTPANPTAGFSTPTEVDTWASTDAVVVYNPVQVNIVYAGGQLIDYNGSYANQPSIYQLTMYDPGGIDNDNLIVNGSLVTYECQIQRFVDLNFTIDDEYAAFQNTDNIGGLASGASTFGAVEDWAGILAGGQENILGDLEPAADIILGSSVEVASAIYGALYLDTSVVFHTDVEARSTTSGSVTSPIVWGPGTFNAWMSSMVTYPSGAGKGAATFVNTGGLQIDSQSLACKGQPGAGGITIACNLSLNAALLDTNAGATSGCTFVAGGAAFCNFGYP